MSTSELATGPRDVFAERFALLYAEAGNPPLKRITETVLRSRAVDEHGRPLRVPAQRISDWRRGRNVPARFTALAAVLQVLIGEARKRRFLPVASGLYEIDAWRDLWEAALASPLAPEPSPAGTAEPAQRATDEDIGVCPYRGLAAFRQEDSAWFFGRERSTADLVERLRQAYATGGFVVLVGPSGAGKSSLVRAGLGPALEPATLASDHQCSWPVLTMTPGVDPLKELGLQIPELAPILREATRATAEGSDPIGCADFPERVRRAVTAYAAREGTVGAGLVLVVDQFEEAFTLCPDEETRVLFIHTLHALCTSGSRDVAPGPETDATTAPGLVVLGIRADFYDRCLAYPELVDAMQDRQMALGAMSAAELRDAVLRPARAVGLQLEPGLVELMLTDLGITVQRSHSRIAPAGYEAGALPLLSHALLATWQRRHSGKLTTSGYRAAGGIHGAVAATAERAWADLDDAGQAAARRMLLRLVQVGETTRDTRRRSSRTELVSHHSGDGAAAEQALEVLTSARLVTLDADSVEITHEALLEAWPRLRAWIDDNRAENLARQRLESDAATWEEQRRDSSLLYRGARLETAERWADGPDPAETTPVARAFLSASAHYRKRSTWLRRSAVALLCVFALIAGVAAAIAINERDEAEYSQLVAESDRMQGPDASLAARMQLAAHQLRPDDKSNYTRLLSTQHLPLATPMTGHTAPVFLTSYSPDGTLVASASSDQTVRLWDVRDPTKPRALGEPLTAHTSWVTTAVFSPDGKTLATTGDDDTIRLWDVSAPASPHLIGKPIEPGNGTMYLAAFSPDGATLATANGDRTVGLWNVADPAKPRRIRMLTGHTDQVRSIAFSRDGGSLASTGDDGSIRLWDVTDPAEAKLKGKPLSGHHALVHSVAFSSDGRMVASGSHDKTVRLWDTATGKPIGQVLTGHTAAVWSVAFSPDGTILASAGEDSTVRLWNVAGGDPAVPLGRPLEARSNGMYAVGFSPDGRTLASGSGDNLVRLWSLPDTVLLGHTSGVTASAFRPDGKVLATGSDDTSVRLWDTTDPGWPKALGAPLSGHDDYVRHAVFRSDGRVLATSSGDKTVRLWDVADPAQAKPLGKPLKLNTRYASPLAMSPDGRVLATGGESPKGKAGDGDKVVRLWDISVPARPKPLGTPLTGHTTYVNNAVFSADGRTLVTASSDQTIRLWDVTEPAEAAAVGEPLTAHDGEVNDLAISPDGAVLATASSDKTVQLWDVREPARPKRLGEPLSRHTEGVVSVAFSRDSRRLATSSSDSTVRLWDVTEPAEPRPIGQALTAHVDAPHTVSFSPAGEFLFTGGGDGVGRVWNLDVDQVIERICATTRGMLTPEQWDRHIPQLDYEPTC